jgi:hypothetical protein
MNEASDAAEIEWVQLLQGGTDGIRDAVQLLESAGITPSISAVPGG